MKPTMKLLTLVPLLLAIILSFNALPEIQEEKGIISLWGKGARWVLKFLKGGLGRVLPRNISG